MGVESLARRGIPFHGSLVLMPEAVGWEDIEQTVSFLDGQGCRTIRLLMPGYTDWGRSRGQSAGMSLSDWDSLGDRVDELRDRYRTPITTEPALWDRDGRGATLSARVEGVIKGSPAAAAGLRSGDQITEVDGIKVFSRVDAFERVRQSGCPRLKVVRRDGRPVKELEIQVAKSPGESSGLVMNYDIAPQLVRRIKDRAVGGGTLVLTSRLAGPVLKAAGLDGVFIQAAANQTLGGNIGCAGLLTVSDLVEGFHEFRDRSPGMDLQRVLVPEIAFDHRGEDLTGRGFWEIESLTGVKVISI
ncbi:MAG: PDZ domain-containing protein [Firmicutes bacterium]|nr:PDZ domain-containing protein [Bacillota bacterium]